jgi:ankyrin repeat protein
MTSHLSSILVASIFSLFALSCGNRVDEDLRRSAIKGDSERLKILLASGASVNYRHGGWTVLMFAVREGHVVIVQQLLGSHADPNATSKGRDGATPLTIAAEHGHLEIAKLLLKSGAHVDARNAHGNTALMYTAEYNYPKLAEVLLSAGADLTLKDNDGETALQIAQRKNHSQILSVLSVLNGRASPAP